MTRVPGIRPRLATESAIPVDIEEGMFIVRMIQDTPLVHQALCPHRGAPLLDAYQIGPALACSWHRSVFRCSDGHLLYGPAKSGIRVRPAHFEGDDLVIGDSNDD